VDLFITDVLLCIGFCLSKFLSFNHLHYYLLSFANKGTTHFSLESDRAILCGVVKHGYGQWDKIRQDIHGNKNLLFQHTVQGMNTDAIAKRCDYRMRQMEKELEVREKKLSLLKPPAVTEAEVALEAIKNMEAWESEARMLEMQGEKPPPVTLFVKSGLGTLSEYVKERQSCIDKLREVETQIRGCRLMAEEAKISILRGDQGINFGHISLKTGGPRAGRKEAAGYGVELEAKINCAVLKIPECGDCKVCIHFGLFSCSFCDCDLMWHYCGPRISTAWMKMDQSCASTDEQSAEKC
jgi:hypothetical protein